MRMTAFAVFNLLLFVSVFCLIPVLVGVYVFRDAKRRRMNASLWTLIAILAPSLIGFIIYLLVRGNYSNLKCPRCETTVTEQFVVCPKCGVKLRPSCPNCSTPVELDWAMCPKCAQPLPATQEDIVTPVRPKDKTLWKILVAITLIPAIMILAFAALFSINSSSTSFREVSLNTYFSDEELPQSTKDYVRDWVNNLPDEENHVYALRFRYQVLEDSQEKDYYYLIYIPGCGSVSSNSFGYAAGLFGIGGELKLELNGNGTEESFYCMMISGKKQAPGIRVVLNGKRLEDIVTVVDFNPTLYTIATTDDYSMLMEASGDYYSKDAPNELKPIGLAITKIENGQVTDAIKHEEPDFLLTTVVNIHELSILDEPPVFVDGYAFSDCCTISIDFVDATGETDYRVTAEYCAVQQGDMCYLIDINHGLVYQLDENAYGELLSLFE